MTDADQPRVSKEKDEADSQMSKDDDADKPMASKQSSGGTKSKTDTKASSPAIENAPQSKPAPMGLQATLGSGGSQVGSVGSAGTGSTGPVTNPYRNQDNGKFFFVFFLIFSLVAFIAWLLHVNHERSRNLAEKNLELAIRQFPKNPDEYATLEVGRYDITGWRRFNFRNIAIFSAAVVSAFTVVYWHRQKKLEQEKRRTVHFWMLTATGALVGCFYGAYMVQQTVSKPARIMRQVKSDPFARALFILGTVVMGAIVLFLLRGFYKRWEKKREKALRRQQAQNRRLGVQRRLEADKGIQLLKDVQKESAKLPLRQ